MYRIKSYSLKIWYCWLSGILKLYPRLKTRSNVLFKGIPNLLITRGAEVIIGDGTIINSSNFGYHMNMFAKCKLYADRPGAKIEIGRNCRVHGTCIHAFNNIKIGDNCLIAANTQIVDGNGHRICSEDPSQRILTTDDGKPVVIGNNVWIAAHCIILGGTTIGSGSIISAGSVVKGEVPPNSIYGGNPAKFIREL